MVYSHMAAGCDSGGTLYGQENTSSNAFVEFQIESQWPNHISKLNLYL